MAETPTPPSEWKLDHKFKDAEDSTIDCGRDDCSLGSYTIENTGHGELRAPACVTCEFSGTCSDVFNADEPRFEPGAPEDFKRGAARVLIHGVYSPLDAIKAGRPKTAQMIEEYATLSMPTLE